VQRAPAPLPDEDEVRRGQRAAEDGHGRHPRPCHAGADENRGERGRARQSRSSLALIIRIERTPTTARRRGDRRRGAGVGEAAAVGIGIWFGLGASFVSRCLAEPHRPITSTCPAHLQPCVTLPKPTPGDRRAGQQIAGPARSYLRVEWRCCMT
jgi:hypothetical protein